MFDDGYYVADSDQYNMHQMHMASGLLISSSVELLVVLDKMIMPA